MLMTQVQYWANQEIKRHNLRTEELTDFSNREIQRHNMKSESQTDWYNAEVKRHNIASEGIGWRQAQAAMMSANAALSQAAAAHRQADTAQFRAETDRQVGYTNAAGEFARNKAQADLFKAQQEKTINDIGLGYFNSFSNFLGNAGKLFGSFKFK